MPQWAGFCYLKRIWNTIVSGPSVKDRLRNMAAGKPIVASDVPGNRDILRDGETALLCPPDAPDVLAGAIARLVAEPALAAALGAAARAEAREKYDISGMTDAYLTLWNAPGR